MNDDTTRRNNALASIRVLMSWPPGSSGIIRQIREVASARAVVISIEKLEQLVEKIKLLQGD